MPIFLVISLNDTKSSTKAVKQRIDIDVYTMQDNKIYVSNIVDLNETMKDWDFYDSKSISLFFPLPFETTPKSMYHVIDGKVDTDSTYDFDLNWGLMKLTIYARNYETFMNELKDNDYKLKFSYYLRLKDFIGYLDKDKTQLGFFINNSRRISELNIHIDSNRFTIPEHQRTIIKVNDSLYKAKRRWDSTETRIEIKDDAKTLDLVEWDEQTLLYIRNRKIVIPIVYLGLAIDLILITILVISRVKNKIIVPKGEYIKSPEGLLDPNLIESLVDRKVNPNALITTCIINLIKKGNINNIDNDKIELKDISNIDKVERIVLDILFLNKDNNQDALKQYVGKTISILDLNNKIKNDKHFSDFFNRKLDDLKIIIKNQLTREKYISAKWNKIMKIIKTLANWLIVITLLSLSILSARNSDNDVPYFLMLPMFLLLIYGASFTKNYVFVLAVYLPFIVMGLLAIVAYTFIRFDYTLLLFIIMEILLVIIRKFTNTYVYTEKGKQEYKKARMFKNYLVDYSLISNRDMDGLVIYDDYLVYATAFGIASTITKKINGNLVDLNSKIQKLIT